MQTKAAAAVAKIKALKKGGSAPAAPRPSLPRLLPRRLGWPPCCCGAVGSAQGGPCGGQAEGTAAHLGGQQASHVSSPEARAIMAKADAAVAVFKALKRGGSAPTAPATPVAAARSLRPGCCGPGCSSAVSSEGGPGGDQVHGAAALPRGAGDAGHGGCGVGRVRGAQERWVGSGCACHPCCCGSTGCCGPGCCGPSCSSAVGGEQGGQGPRRSCSHGRPASWPRRACRRRSASGVRSASPGAWTPPPSAAAARSG